MKKIISTLLIISFIVTSSLTVFAEAGTMSEEEHSSLKTALSLIDHYGITENESDSTIYKALMKLASEDDDAFYKVMNAIAQTIDEHSCYYSKEEWEFFSKELSGVICGIGVTAMVVNGCFEVVTLIEGGSAKEAGIEVGDSIIEADGTDITGPKASIASSYITGEKGTFVTIKVKKKNGIVNTYTLERREVIVPSVVSDINDNIGYIEISSFTEKTTEEFKKVLDDFKSKDVKDIIIDLRYNGGGVMMAGINCASLLMKKGETVITTRTKNEKEEPVKYTVLEDGYDFNTVILTNKYTASASEIMTCALVENGHAVSVGETTYGKASAQRLFPLTTGGALRITVQHYYTPKDNFINKYGITPVHEVENETYRYTFEEAPRLTYSVKYKKGDTASEIEGIEKMLNSLGYLSKTPDSVYDEYTENAVSLFQKNSGLFSYGVCDITTQSYLVNKYIETDFIRDNQLDYAVEILSK